ncbi:MAG TPA: tetratricopeptide repeat protein [Candidatus Sulfotelmatobacter sp.]|nr:tetratricopeptide repeat protein [Candidatus Sulfotelmatobacter sp.]
MDTQTRHALKGDKFAQATKSSVEWVSGHRSGVTRWVISGAIALVVIVAALIFWNIRSASADTALGTALDAYSAPLLAPGAPASNGFYATSAERSKAANQQFVSVAQQYGWLPEGTKAHYFAGVTYAELGQNGPAESELKEAAGSWDKNLANLAKLALAGLYHQTGRDAQAIDLYNEIVAKPSVTVSAAVAQLDLADLYVAQGKQDQARTLWARVKDADKDGTAGSIAAQKLTGPTQ